MALATILLNACRVLGAGLKAAGLPARSSVADIVGAVATLGLVLMLTPRLGLTGAAVAVLISYLASLAYLAWTAHRELGISPWSLFVPTRADFLWLQGLCQRWLVRRASLAVPRAHL
ncbi:MAG: polysaccharide biosynthesis C-terminal domain-containing protein [Chloroflexota bacterium]